MNINQYSDSLNKFKSNKMKKYRTLNDDETIYLYVFGILIYKFRWIL